MSNKLLFQFTIPGRPSVKKNNKRIFSRGRFKKVLNSLKYEAWERDAILHFKKHGPKDFKKIDQTLEAKFYFYFENKMAEADTSNLIEGPQDLLTKLGVIKDDKLIKRLTAEKFFYDSPRTLIELYGYEDQNLIKGK